MSSTRTTPTPGTACLPPAANASGESLAALSGGGQGEGTPWQSIGALLHPLRVAVTGQSGLSIEADLLRLSRATRAPKARSVARRGSAAINFGGCVAPDTASVPDGNHGDNFDEVRA